MTIESAFHELLKSTVPDRLRREAMAHPECSACQLAHEMQDTMMPPHDGSRSCESGSVASGGERTHCTCDRCY